MIKCIINIMKILNKFGLGAGYLTLAQVPPKLNLDWKNLTQIIYII